MVTRAVENLLMVAAGVVGTSYGEKFFVCKAREWLVGDRECGAGG